MPHYVLDYTSLQFHSDMLGDLNENLKRSLRSDVLVHGIRFFVQTECMLVHGSAPMHNFRLQLAAVHYCHLDE